MNPCHELLQNKELLAAAIAFLWAAHAVLEAWLGKTDKVKAGSLLELLYNLVVRPQARVYDFPTPKQGE